jgi:hypothetical protein
MPINAGAICLGHCYVTAGGEVRKIIETKAAIITYVVRGKIAFPTWDPGEWHYSNREVFAQEVTHEVPCDWQRDDARPA